MPTPPAIHGIRDGTSGPAWPHHPFRSQQSLSRPSRPASSAADTAPQHRSSAWRDSSMSLTPDADSLRTSSNRSPCPSGASSGAWAPPHSRTHSSSRTSQRQQKAPTCHHHRQNTGRNASTTVSSSPSFVAGGCFGASKWQQRGSPTCGSRQQPLAGWRSSRSPATRQARLGCVLQGHTHAPVPTTWRPSAHTTP